MLTLASANANSTHWHLSTIRINFLQLFVDGVAIRTLPLFLYPFAAVSADVGAVVVAKILADSKVDIKGEKQIAYII